ncbi:hypothetical protein KXV51_007048 [Aspergillus fumigatus]|nr:hypothetical protein KXX38_003887 [Aspergillus fumigatus]KAH1500183.1 hypothetical protein KXX06_001567 [Aspergillus fumigatus]KAH2023063.1 hypothetical protein KXV65_001053 [Aspergillus fumigatus]KAH2292318.1 hypothetical protein KXW82_000952 [Aspergillus fumigatus]KAH2694399.1 hypothetical protein KXV51_007048 [Aspergillus fumigatus]
MSKILILGATGYLGKHVAYRLVQSGQHTVYGVARSKEKAAQLAQQEIIPVLCSNPVEDPEPYLSVIRSENIDIVVDISGANQDSYSFLYNVKLIGQKRQKEYEELTIWPSFVTPLLNAARDGETTSIEIPLDADARPGLIHVDDVARAFQCSVAKLPCLSGTGVYPVFDLVTSQEGLREIFESMAVSWGFKGTVTLKGAGGDKFAKAMSTTFPGSSARAEQLLGWRPRRLAGFVKDMNVYAAAFAAQ